MATSSVPTEETSTLGDSRPEPSPSHLSPARQELVDDIIALYSCHPTRERILRYTPDCVYDDQFVHADGRYKVAGLWFALPQLFETSTNEGYQIVRSDADVIQFNIQQVLAFLSLLSCQLRLTLRDEAWTFRMITQEAALGTRVTPTIDSLVTLTLDPETLQSDTMKVKHHREQTSEENYNQELLGYTFKKWQADQVVRHMDSPEIEAFKGDIRKADDRYGVQRGGV